MATRSETKQSEKDVGHIGLARKLVSRAEAARRMGISVATIDRMVADGRLPKPRKVGPFQQSGVRFAEDDLNAAISRLMADRL